MPIIHFLLTYDRAKQVLVSVVEFDRRQEAVAELERLEREHAGDEQTEIVLLGADSLETIKLTHANYFEPVMPVKDHRNSPKL